jgi:hypothetical protein
LIRQFVVALAKEPDQELVVLVLWEVRHMLRSESISAADLINPASERKSQTHRERAGTV